MNNTKHTPGKIFSNFDMDGSLELFCGKNNKLIAEIIPGGERQFTEEDRANAARIVNTWNCHDELLEALRHLLRGMPQGISPFREGEEPYEASVTFSYDDVNRALAAYANATGQGRCVVSAGGGKKFVVIESKLSLGEE